jgi:hypothetical protein
MPYRNVALLAFFVVFGGCTHGYTIDDTDGDMLYDVCEETLFGTNSRVVDSDGDGVVDALEDHDNDGCANIHEQTKEDRNHAENLSRCYDYIVIGDECPD